MTANFAFTMLNYIVEFNVKLPPNLKAAKRKLKIPVHHAH